MCEKTCGTCAHFNTLRQDAEGDHEGRCGWTPLNSGVDLPISFRDVDLEIVTAKQDATDCPVWDGEG